MMQELVRAERLDQIAQRVGFAVWQIQELEGVAAQYYVLVAIAELGMGVEAGLALVEQAQSKTFGSTVNKLVKGNHLPEVTKERFSNLLAERNWLVHNSRSSSRNAIHHQELFQELLVRLDAITTQALELLHALSTLSEQFVRSKGISAEQIQANANQTLRSWHAK